MKLDADKILRRANHIYTARKCGPAVAEFAQLEIRSDQVKALLFALVEAINADTQSDSNPEVVSGSCG